METIRLKQSFITLISYEPETETLFLALKSGKQYSYKHFTAWEELKQANNKGSWIANNVLTGKQALQGEFVRLLSPAEINQNLNYTKHLGL